MCRHFFVGDGCIYDILIEGNWNVAYWGATTFTLEFDLPAGTYNFSFGGCVNSTQVSPERVGRYTIDGTNYDIDHKSDSTALCATSNDIVHSGGTLDFVASTNSASYRNCYLGGIRIVQTA